MKSAYELAMERLEKDKGPSKKLSEDQRERMAEIDKIFDAKIAEHRLSYEARMATPDPAQLAQIQEEFTAKLSDLENDRMREKESVWDSA
jgi:hypothetical protein